MSKHEPSIWCYLVHRFLFFAWRNLGLHCVYDDYADYFLWECTICKKQYRLGDFPPK